MEESHVGKILTLKGVEAEQKVVYIIHEETGHVITSQCKVWNDTVRMYCVVPCTVTGTIVVP